MSSTMTKIATKLANAASIEYLVRLIEERTTAPVTEAQFAGFTQQRVSDLIETALKQPCLPATEEQLALVAELAAKLNRGQLATKDRGQASRQIRAMQADLDARANAKREMTPERAEQAASDLSAILGGTAPATAPVSDDIPF